MKIEIYKCDYCEKEIDKDYLSKKGWISINENGLGISSGVRENKSILIRLAASVVVSGTHTRTLDFCCLNCFVKWLFLSKETECNTSIDKVSLLKDALMSLVKDDYLGKLIVECLKSKTGGQKMILAKKHVK